MPCRMVMECLVNAGEMRFCYPLCNLKELSCKIFLFVPIAQCSRQRSSWPLLSHVYLGRAFRKAAAAWLLMLCRHERQV
jgi:hypothetical protein